MANENAASGEKKTLKVTLKRSLIGTVENHRQCARALGFRRTQQTVVVGDNATTRGLINKISYLLEVE